MRFKILVVVLTLLGTSLWVNASVRSKKKNKQENRIEKKQDSPYEEFFQGKKYDRSGIDHDA